MKKIDPESSEDLRHTLGVFTEIFSLDDIHVKEGRRAGTDISPCDLGTGMLILHHCSTPPHITTPYFIW